MASTRSTQRTQSRQPSHSADSPRDALIALALRAARIQIAACSAAATSFADWAETVDRFAQVSGDDLSGLPRAAADHFDARLARVPTTT